MNIAAIVPSKSNFSAGVRFRITNWFLEYDENYLIERPKDLDTFNSKIKNIFKNNNKSFSNLFKNNLPKALIIHKTIPSSFLDIIENNFGKKNIPIIFDLCDPPFKHYSLSKKEKVALNDFQRILSISNLVVVSSPSLMRSFSNEINVKYIPDLIDPPILINEKITDNDLPNILYSSEAISGKEELNLCWFGGAGRKSLRSGIHELIESEKLLVALSNKYIVNLNICSNLTNEQKSELVDKCKRNKVSKIIYNEWSIENVAKSINSCDFCFLPRLNSHVTYYKSPNRLATALSYSKRTITSNISDPEYDIFNPIKIDENNIPENLHREKKITSFPSTWSRESIIQEWNNIFNSL